MAAVALALVITVGRLGQPHYDDRPYPVELVRYLDRNEVDLTEVRLGGPERVGNLLELLHGPRGEVFVDDRFDLQSDAVSDDLVTLLGASTGARRVLDRWDLSLVLWPRSAALSQVLLAAPEWRVLAGEEAWLLFCREGAELGGDLGRC